jgi:hypothetical protein
MKFETIDSSFKKETLFKSMTGKNFHEIDIDKLEIINGIIQLKKIKKGKNNERRKSF